MEITGARIKVDYTDEECWNGVLYEASAELFVSDGKMECVETKCVNYEYNE